jgi:replicative DNA helicase
MSALRISAKNPKKFETAFPKLDDGNVDWSTVKKRMNDNLDLSSYVFGKTQPAAMELEEAILGACLLDTNAFPIAQEAMLFEPEPFYSEANNKIWAALSQLNEAKDPIDILTVTHQLRKTGNIDAVGGSYHLVKLADRVGSSANIEYHARIVFQMCKKRKLIHFFSKGMRALYDDSTDVFDLVQELGRELNEQENPRAALKAMTMPEFMKKVKTAVSKSHMMGDLVKQHDVAIFFSGPANGKSVFMVQAADAIAKGQPLLSGHLRNECGEQKVLYFDLELGESDFKSRYLDGAGNEFAFSENFVRIGKDEDSHTSFADFAKNAKYLISRNIEKHKPNVVVIDNITALSNGATADYVVASEIMDTLISLKHKYKLTVIVLAHTPKRYNTTTPLSINDLAGSAMLGNYADSINAIGASKMGDKVKYIKQIKVRSGIKRYDDENVLQVSIEKEGANLLYKCLEMPTGREQNHLTEFNQDDENEMLREAQKLQDKGLSLRKIVFEMGLKISHVQLKNKLDAYQEGGGAQNEINERNTEGLKIIDHNHRPDPYNNNDIIQQRRDREAAKAATWYKTPNEQTTLEMDKEPPF